MRKLISKFKDRQRNIYNAAKSGLFKKYLQSSSLWHYNRDSVSRGVAAGLFAAMVPIPPFQTMLVICVSILIRANIPIAFAVSWVSNPLTIIPIFYATYLVGDRILGESITKISIHNISWNFDSMHDFFVSFHLWISQFGQAFFVGLPIVAFGSAIIGYIIGTLCWQGVILIRRHTHK